MDGKSILNIFGLDRLPPNCDVNMVKGASNRPYQSFGWKLQPKGLDGNLTTFEFKWIFFVD